MTYVFAFLKLFVSVIFNILFFIKNDKKLRHKNGFLEIIFCTSMLGPIYAIFAAFENHNTICYQIVCICSSLAILTLMTGLMGRLKIRIESSICCVCSIISIGTICLCM